MKLNLESIDSKIKTLKYPLVFLFSLLKLSKTINDKDLSDIIRIFLKYHNDTIINFPIINLLKLVDNSYYNSKKIIISFYKLISDKIKFAWVLIKFRKAFKYKFIWSKSIKEQLKFLEKFKIRLLSYFDMNFNNKPFHEKILHSLYRNNKLVINETIERLKNIFKLFGIKFFEEYKILYIYEFKFRDFDYKDKMKYLMYIYQKLNLIIDNIINIYKLYILTNSEIKNIITPKISNVKIVENDENTNSITDSDVSFLIEN